MVSGRGYLDNVRLVTARQAPGADRATWVQSCSCPSGYEGQFCEKCTAGYKRRSLSEGLFSSCLPCSCRGGSCDPETGLWTFLSICLILNCAVRFHNDDGEENAEDVDLILILMMMVMVMLMRGLMIALNEYYVCHAVQVTVTLRTRPLMVDHASLATTVTLRSPSPARSVPVPLELPVPLGLGLWRSSVTDAPLAPLVGAMINLYTSVIMIYLLSN